VRAPWHSAQSQQLKIFSSVTSAMPHHYDAIIIGASHNGLTCACYLARVGLKVLVLEQYHTVGGMTVTEEETLPGFWSDIHASGYQLANLSPVPRELDLLDRYKIIEPEIPFSHAFPNGDIISVHRDVEKTAADIARHSLKEGQTWRVLMNRFRAEKDAITAAMFSRLLHCRQRQRTSPHRLREWTPIDSACRPSDHGRIKRLKPRRPKLCSVHSPLFSVLRQMMPVARSLAGFLPRSYKTPGIIW
jgi:hypothetical protein